MPTATALLSSPVKKAKSDSLGRLKMILWIIDDSVGVVWEANKESDKIITKYSITKSFDGFLYLKTKL